MSEHTLFELIRVCLAVGVVSFTIMVIVCLTGLTWKLIRGE